MTKPTNATRRAFLGSTGMALVAAPAMMSQAQAAGVPEGTMTYEVTRSEEEWRERLSNADYGILREFGTEQRFSSDHWDREEDGHYACKGCDLPIYESEWKTIRPIGWVFFFHANTDSVLTSIDEWPVAMNNAEGMAETRHVIEAHCRRCGSHLGHMLIVQGDLLHCINGAALTFVPKAA